jgi:predicted TIM-barrel fold metal-dependent hydrolase
MYTEDAIEPEIPLCDAHHHFTDFPSYPYLLKDFIEDIGGGHDIRETVFIECKAYFDNDELHQAHPEGETQFVDSIALESASKHIRTKVAAGIVGFADLTLGDAVTPILEAHLATSPERFKGIRYGTCWDRNFHSPNNPLRDVFYDLKFREGFACLKKYNLSFDSFLFHTQLKELADLARAFPNTTIILNHFGGLLGVGPYAINRQAAIAKWKSGLVELAACDNVVVKLGGFAMGLCGFNLNHSLSSTDLARVMSPYYMWCIDQFGPYRCMFESNFPVDKQSYSYSILWNAFKLMSKGFSATERAAMLRNTALKTYRL